MPTGRAIEDVRRVLFDAAEHVLLRDGSSALTSRAITAEAGVAKGVLHRHFEDVDAFLTDLVLDRIEQIRQQGPELRHQAGSGTVIGNLTHALERLFGSIASAILELVTARDAVRARLRAAGSIGVPVLTEGAAMLSDYLEAERAGGRVAADADVATLALTLVGSAHLLHVGHEAAGPDRATLERTVATVMAGALVVED